MTDLPKSLPLLEKLVGFDTTSRNSNRALIEFARDYLDGFGIRSRLTFDDEGGKANLFATIGPETGGGIVLSGHTDVVPVDDQAWDSDPFTLLVQDGRAFGRGAADMKGFVAAALALVPKILAANLKRPVHLAFSYDEEVGCIGVRRLLADLATLPFKPGACLIGEPTSMKIINGHKGKMTVSCQVHGRPGHSALPHLAVNAVEAAAEIVSYLRRLGRRLAKQGPFDERFDPPYTTVHTGTIQGGTALNIVPRDCRFDFEFRALPGHDPHALLAEARTFAESELIGEMREIAPEAGVTWAIGTDTPGLLTEEDAEIIAFAKALTGENAVGKVSYGTEGGLFQQAGIPTVICGPGSIAQAHRENEYVALSQLTQCEQFLDRMITRLAG